MASPKLEFYRFSLNHKESLPKTFRDFAKDELGGKGSMSNGEIFKLCFEHFIKKLTDEHAKSPKKRKTITLIEDEKKNPYLKNKPTLSQETFTLSGVINGGFYDKEAIVSNIGNKQDNDVLNRDKAILLPYFVFAYLPADHFEGFFCVHSNSREDSITDIFRGYITNTFSGNNYNKAVPVSFCPEKFQKEYRDKAVIKEMVFSTTVLNNELSNNPIITSIDGYKVELKISKIAGKDKKKVSLAAKQVVLDFLSNKGFKKGNGDIDLQNFDRKKVVVEESVGSKHPKTFALESIEKAFIPVVPIENLNVSISSDTGLPDFDQLKTSCAHLFANEILKEIRPDLYVTKSK